MKGVLNENTKTIHKREQGERVRTACGVSYHIESEQLRTTLVERAVVDADVSRCGRCFDGIGGY